MYTHADFIKEVKRFKHELLSGLLSIFSICILPECMYTCINH